MRRLPPDTLAASQSDQGDEHDHHGHDPEIGIVCGVALDTVEGEDADDGHSDDELGEDQLLDADKYNIYI